MQLRCESAVSIVLMPALALQSAVEDSPAPFLPSEPEEEPDIFFASPGREESSAAGSDLQSSYDLFGSFQPRTQDLVPEVLLREPDGSSPAVSSYHVSCP